MSENVRELLLSTYPLPARTFVRGEGALLFDDEGRRYIDLLAGIAVVSAGHGNAAVARAIAEQASQVVHLSNFFANRPALQLARELQRITGVPCRSFFANSGAEANECAIKLVRKWGNPNRQTIVCARGGFHGRTLGALAATGQPAKWQGFEPLPGGFVHATYNDLASFERAIDERTVAVLVEPVLGEHGVVPGTREFLHGLRTVCDERNLALVFDEVQTGIGRTGTWWAFQQLGVTPDIVTSAKALGNGLPIGACLVLKPELQEVFQPGDHATTFGGGAVPSAAALATLRYLRDEKVLESVAPKGELLRNLLSGTPGVTEVRGLGLMLGVVLEKPVAKDVVRAALDEGVIVNAPAPDILRLTPPLVITDDLLTESATLLSGIISSIS